MERLGPPCSAYHPLHHSCSFFIPRVKILASPQHASNSALQPRRHAPCLLRLPTISFLHVRPFIPTIVPLHPPSPPTAQPRPTSVSFGPVAVRPFLRESPAVPAEFELSALLGSSIESTGDLFLVTANLQPATLRQYRRAIADFAAWLRRQPSMLPITGVSKLDRAVAVYAHYCFSMDGQRGFSKVYLGHLVAGLAAFFPTTCKALPLAAGSFAGWMKLCPSVSATPMPHSLLLALMGHFAATGRPLMSLLLWLSFHCLLRLNEALNITTDDFCMNTPTRSSGTGAQDSAVATILLPRTKSGVAQSVTILEPGLASAMSVAITLRRQAHAEQQCRHPPSAAPHSSRLRLFPYSPYSFSTEFKEAVAFLIGLIAEFTHHSLRHGGATHLFVSGRLPIDDIQFRGRWKQLITLRTYIQSGRSSEIAGRLPPAIVQFAALHPEDQWGFRLAAALAALDPSTLWRLSH